MMIEKYDFFVHDIQKETSREIRLLSIISQSFFQPFSLEDNLLVILTALTSGSGVGFNRAMLFLTDKDQLKGEMWLGPRSMDEANSIWELLSTPGIGYFEIVEYNRLLLNKNEDTLSNRIRGLTYRLKEENSSLPSLAAAEKKVFSVKDAWNEPLVDKDFLEIIKTDNFLCIPLLARDEILGEIIVDNAITQNPIEAKEIELASICGLMAGNIIYTKRLHNRMVEMEKSAAMGEMAMFITHQLRNPLATIGGFTDQLLNPQIEEGKKIRNLQIIKNEINRAEEVLQQMGRFLKIEIKELVSSNVPTIIDSVLTSAEEAMKSRGVRLKVELEKELPSVLCDPTYIGEALRNLLDNALDASSQGGEVSIRGFKEDKQWVVISIEDTGKGIPEHIKNKIFVPLFSTKEKGMGLGLSYVQRVINACGGRVSAESEEGSGTRVKLFLKSDEREVKQ